jgi:hypothetical protein
VNSRRLIPIGSLLLAFVLGLALGFFIGGAPSPDVTEKTIASSSSPNASASEAGDPDSLLKTRIVELEKELENQKRDQDALIMEDRLALFKKYPHTINSPAFDENLKVAPAMADILKLSTREQQAIEQHLKEIQEETQKIEDAKMVLVKQSGNSVTYEIPAYADDGGKEIKAKLNSLLSSDIGGARTELFLNNSEWDIKSQFSNFGEGKTQIEITRTDRDGNPSYRLKESYFSDNSATSSTSRSVTLPTNSLPARYAKLLQLDPAP